MILVDTSVWIDHLRRPELELFQRLDAVEVLSHPWVIGEIALGSLRDRATVIESLLSLPKAVVAEAEELLMFIDRHALAGAGISYIDAALLAAVRLTPDASLWTRDKRLARTAVRLDVPLYASNSGPLAE